MSQNIIKDRFILRVIITAQKKYVTDIIKHHRCFWGLEVHVQAGNNKMQLSE
jgi:hypothetical protein